jgi:flagellar hook protein FlgE
MDVVADNLSNANTTGYKASRLTFQSQIAQMVNIGQAPAEDAGGVNPTQVGLGTKIGTISPTFTQGMMQSTGRNTDMAIDGDGFFIFSDGTREYYSRDGAMGVDSEGFLVNAATGMRIQGWQAENEEINPEGEVGSIQIPIGDSLAQATTEAMMGGNLNAATETGANGEFEMVFNAFNSLGGTQTVTLTLTKTADNAWAWEGPDGTSHVLTFDEDTGRVDTGGGPVDIDVTGENGAADLTISVDFSSVTQYDAENSISATDVDGIAAGSLVSFDVISQTGEVLGIYSNGMKQLVGQVALATFSNPTGLVRNGNSMFLQGLNSGEPSVGQASTGGRGSVVAGYLEASNVDLAKEFTNMILAQRGFQAQSRVITTSDEMMQELVNIKR